MSLSKTWYTSANRSMDDITTAVRTTGSILFALKGFLTGALTGTAGTGGQPPSSGWWTVDSSSKSTSASSGDVFSASFVAAEWVRAAAASPHSWYVLKSPVSSGIQDGPYYLLVSMGTANDANITLSISKTQPTGGTTSADPTATVQSTYASAAFMPGTTSAGRCHVVMDAKGNFHFLASLNGGGRFCSHIAVNELVEARSSGDSARAVLIADGLNSGVGVPRYSELTTLGTGWRGLSQDAATAVTSTTGFLLTATWNNSNPDQTVRAHLNAIDSKLDGLPIVYCYDGTVGKTGTRGRIPDMWYCGAQDPVGSGTPAAATPDRILAGSCLIPFSVVPSL